MDVPPLYEEQGEQAWARTELAQPDDSPPLYAVERGQGGEADFEDDQSAPPQDGWAQQAVPLQDRNQWGRPALPRLHFARADVLFYGLMALILAGSIWLRFDHQNWDDFTHLHPDERFLTDVVSSLGGSLHFTDKTTAEQEQHRLRCEQKYPALIEGDPPVTVRFAGQGGYFDADCSPLNPNNLGKGLYVYGEFPLFTAHAAAAARSQLSRDYHDLLEAVDPDAADDHIVTTYWETYTGAQLVGRSLSALADVLTILVLFLLGRRLYNRWVGLLAMGLYGFSAFPIQQSHFWTVDAFTTFWVTLSLYLAVCVLDGIGTQKGPRSFLYLLIWFGGLMWDTGYHDRPILGLLALGAAALLMIGISAALQWVWRGYRLPGGDLWGALPGVMATVICLAGWSTLNIVAPHEFTIGDDLIEQGMVSLIFSMAALVTYVSAQMVRRHSLGLERVPYNNAIIGVVIAMFLGLVTGVMFGTLAPWAALFVALVTIALLIFDITDLTDYALFGLAVGATVASRINMAPLAGMIVIAAGLRALPAFDRALNPNQRSRLLAYAAAGLMVSGLMAFITFRLLQPHAFLGPNIIGLQFNPGWRDDMSEAAYLTSGEWDAPPNHQWADRTPYFFPWRNIVLWGMGIPLGLIAWAAWAWAGLTIVRGRKNWTRHIFPFVWILVAFGWLGGRWVTTMRYFLPIYPALAVLAAWALWVMIVEARRMAGAQKNRAQQAAPLQRRLRRGLGRAAYVGAVLLLILTTGYTTLYGFAFHTIQRQQLTRVAAARWFQETISGDMGLWVEGLDGTRQLINVGRTYVAPVPKVYRMEQGETLEINVMPVGIVDATGQPAPITIAADAVLTRIILNRLGDPGRDAGEEVLRVRLFRNDPNLGRQLMYEGTVREDVAQAVSPYGGPYAAVPDSEIILPALDDFQVAVPYVVEISLLEGGPVMFVRDVSDAGGSTLFDVSIGLQMVDSRTLTFVDLNLPDQPILTGHGDDIPLPPTQWTLNGSDMLSFPIPIDGEIRTMEIPHLGDPLMDTDEEEVRFTLLGPDGAQTSATVRSDFSQGANPLGLPQTVTFDPPLQVKREAPDGSIQSITLMVEAKDPIYTSGPVIAWEGAWDDPVPWPVCPLPDDMVYRDDLPSGLSKYTCAAIDMYGGYYQGIELWMVAEDNDQKYQAMTNALDQADYIVITSNRFYDTVTRMPMRWPMTTEFYKALFAGEVGFEHIRTFDSVPTLGPFRIADQILPSRIPPDTLNEHWESEEAFSVYDHPVVLVFRKTADYTPEKLRAVLDSVSRRSVREAIPGYFADPKTVGLVPWGAKQASKAPTLLQFTEDEWAIQREGGTWRDLFDMDELVNRSQIFAVIAWWLLMILAGWIAWPLLYVALPGLPDRAYPAAKITAWMIVAWIAWAGGTLHLLTWTRLGLLIILIGLALLSLLVIWRRRSEFWSYIRENYQHLLAMEALSLALFLIFLGIRQGNPDLWHGSFGGEKPMDFAYFNAVLRSTIFPPYDPWFAEGYINYYYFGYVIVGAPVKLLGIRPALAYNLIIPALFSMTGVGVFSIAYNWVRGRVVAAGQIVGATLDRYEHNEQASPADFTPIPQPLSPLSRERGVVGDSPLSIFDGEGVGGEAGEGIHQAAPLQEDGNTPSLYAVERGQGGEAKPKLRMRAAGSAWLAGSLALLLAVILGNLGSFYVLFNGVAYVGGWERPLLYNQVRRQEIEIDRARIYQNYYDEAMGDFRSDEGRDPNGTEMAQITQEVQRLTDEHIDNYAMHPPLLSLWKYEWGNLRRQVSAFFKGLPDVLSGEPLQSGPNAPLSSHRWHWGPTRIITELPNNAGGGAIAEMPFFTFLYGDLHAHMMAFPVTLLVLLWLVAEIIGAGYRLRRWWEAGIAVIIGALAVGVLRPVNSWDWITYLLVGAAGLTYVAWIGASRTLAEREESEAAGWLWRLLRPGRARQLRAILFVVPLAVFARLVYYFVQKNQLDQQKLRGLKPGEQWIVPSFTLGDALAWVAAGIILVGLIYLALLIALRARMNKPLLLAWIGRAGMFVGLTFVVGLPFTMFFQTGYNSIKPWEQPTTPLWAYLYVHGTFIFIVISYLLWQTARWLRAFRVRDLDGQAVPFIVIGVALLVGIPGLIVFGVREASVMQLVGPLILWAGLLFFMPSQDALQRAIYAVIVLALAISVGVELVVLDGDIGRQNTVFKFYLQVWFLLSIVGGVGLAWMLSSTYRWNAALRAIWQGGLAILFTIALFYPVLATQARLYDRFNKDETPLTLDGQDYMKYAIHGESGLWFRLEGDYDMIRWLQDNVDGTPVIMEAHQYPSEYHWNARIAINTGLPTILGWNFHQRQQHTLPDLDMLVQNRENNIAAFYETSGSEGIDVAMSLIRDYHIEYIILGALERAFYNDIGVNPANNLQTVGNSPGLAKFDVMAEMGLLEIVFQHPRCLDTKITHLEECPVESVYVDKIYRVVPDSMTIGAVSSME
ncbi:MAG: hypothetical protein HY866_10460 [Chloroflexi bacterium]|nr:hypothetical protein [Chloroflexota bacterium]